MRGASCNLLRKIVQKIISERGNYKKGFFGIRTRPLLGQDIVHFKIAFLFDNLHGVIVEKVYSNIISDRQDM